MSKNTQISSKQFWDEKFAKPALFGTKPASFLLSQQDLLLNILKNNPNATALAVCDGQGRNGVHLAKLGFKVIASEISDVAIKDAQALAKQEKVEDRYITRQEDCLTCDYGEEVYDLIIVIFCQITTDHATFHKKLIKALKKGGYILLTGFTPEQLKYKTGGPPIKEALYTADDLKQQFQGLEILHLQETVGYREEGIHKGTSAYVTLVAKK